MSKDFIGKYFMKAYFYFYNILWSPIFVSNKNFIRIKYHLVANKPGLPLAFMKKDLLPKRREFCFMKLPPKE